ncbi:MAG: V-type ATP synthase subunit D [Candidatus Omnitrophota bacterium]|nr:MAG: V-type ATP synthase subunit D [Candidatus Omnitrophota bacterium]
MAKVRLTKNELKRQKDALKRFLRYLPMLQLKKQQLQVEIGRIHRQIEDLARQMDDFRKYLVSWVDLFAEDVGLSDLIKIESIRTESGNIAGIDIPVFLAVDFQESPYDLLRTPLWVDKAKEACKQEITLKARLLIYHKQVEILKEELRITTQRVNLFEKIKIPQARENIRIINIYTGELQTASVVRGKIAKAKIDKKSESLS